MQKSRPIACVLVLAAVAGCSSSASDSGVEPALGGSSAAGGVIGSGGAGGSSAGATAGNSSDTSGGTTGTTGGTGGQLAAGGSGGLGASGASAAGAGAGGAAAGGAGGSTGGTGGAGTSGTGGGAGTGASSGAGTGGTAMGGAAGSSAGTGAGGAAGTGPSADCASPGALDLVVAANGADNAPGTAAEPTTLGSALGRITAGHTILLRSGTYAFAAQVTIARDNSGASGSPKQLFACPSEHPILDFSSQPYGTGSNPRGLQLEGSFWHVRGLEVQGSADNGIYVAGKSNVVESCVVHGNRDTGLQIGRASSADTDQSVWPSDNLILNCESYDNYDAPPGGGENADGFAAKLTVGTGNVFRGCVSHNNIDDGWDLYTKTDTGAIGPVTIDQCIAYSNGTLTDGTTNENGDRNGFKLGGDKIAVAHVVTRSVAFNNGHNGFTWNSNPGAIRLSNNLAFDNLEGNYKFGDNSTPTEAVFTNNVSFWTTTSGTQSDKAIGTDAGNTNAWWDNSKVQAVITSKGISVTAADFASALQNAKVVRGTDGSPSFAPFALATGSDLIDAGAVPAGALPFDAASYYVSAPDLGAVEKR